MPQISTILALKALESMNVIREIVRLNTNNIQRIGQCIDKYRDATIRGGLLPPNHHPGQQRIHYICTAGERVRQARHRVPPYVSHILYPAFNTWILCLPGWGLGGFISQVGLH